MATKESNTPGAGEHGHAVRPVGSRLEVLSATLSHVVDEPTRTARPYTGFFNLLKGCLGSGILGLPFAFSQTGWALGLIFLFVTAIASAYGLFLLSACAHKLGGTSTSFNRLAGATYPWTRALVDFLIIFNCVGTAISYLVVIGQNLSVLSTSIFGISPASFFATETFWKILVFWGVIAPLGSLSRLSMLKYSSIIGVIFIFYITLMTLVYAVAPSVEPCPDAGGAPHCGGEVVVFSSHGESIMAAIPVFAFAFTCSENIFLVYNEIREPSVKRMRDLVGNPVAIVATIVFATTAMSTYLTYGDNITSDLVLSYPAKDVAVAIADLAIVFIATAGSPLKIHPARQSLTTLSYYLLSFTGKDPRSWWGGKFPVFLYMLSTATLLAAIFCTGMLTSNLGVIFSIIGAVASTGLMFYLPGLGFFKLFSEDYKQAKAQLQGNGDAEMGTIKPSSKATDETSSQVFEHSWLRVHIWASLVLGIMGVALMLVSLVNIALTYK
eukprot:jgi/Tetstr1/462596/TSEL_007582.t1